MARNWDFEAGRLPLDFVNTAEWHASEQPHEMLETYADLLAWSVEAKLLTQPEADRLLKGSTAAPQDSEIALKQVIATREVIYRIFSAISSGEVLQESDLTKFNQALAANFNKAKITSTQSGFEWAWEKSDHALEQILGPILRQTAEILTSKEINRIGQCEDDRGCGYFFYDTSRNHSRRWCSMESCGNRAKARRFYQRKK